MKLFTIEQRKKLLEEELSRIVEVLAKNYEPEKVILFGSLAGGDMHEWSDIDLLIVKKTTKRPLERILEASRLIKPTIGIDLFVYTPEEFDALVQEKFSFLTTIARKGKVLYEKRD
ncbi:MAG: nucleotidyltransferase domain-containing protein [Thermodesulfovibrionales bacterium]|nr:nucleotidyltransferase domain-containing protein [Thermodesulfovibrionales bacterium]